MDPTLLNEMLTSLRIIRDEITKLREKDVAHALQIESLETSVVILERQMRQLTTSKNRQDGGFSLAGKLWAGGLALVGLLVALATYFRGE